MERETFFGGTWSEANYYFGAHPEGDGYTFRLWAPHARAVQLAGTFSEWQLLPMHADGGVWQCHVPRAKVYDSYKFFVTDANGNAVWKADPYAVHTATRPETDSKLAPLDYAWQDDAWQKDLTEKPLLQRPMNIYEVHLGSWCRYPDGNSFDYRKLADDLADYVCTMGYTAVELMPLTEYPLDASWGYQCTGYFAPTSRYGTPQDLKYLVDRLHSAGLAVFLDWVPAHFCKDEQGLYQFDGTCLYEYSDPLKWEHDGWGTRIFDYGKGEVRSFLLSSAMWWLKEYHIDGLRVDAVASMLYLNYGRTDWRLNENGGCENLEAIAFLKLLNRTVHREKPGALMIAEESTAWPHVTGDDGLGFDLKWNMGWMNDLCHYLKMDPFFRQHHHRDVTFSMVYAFSERFILPISHDEVVHMKGSLRGKMPGDGKMQLAGVRSFLAYMLAHPGGKLLFMGGEIPQWHEWDFDGQLDWYLLDEPAVAATHACIRELNHFYLDHSQLWENDRDWDGFTWLVADDNQNNVLVFLRRNRAGKELVCAVNFSPVQQERYRFGVPEGKTYREVFNTDALCWGGSGVCNEKKITVESVPSHGRDSSICIRIPPLGAVYLEKEEYGRPKKGVDHK